MADIHGGKGPSPPEGRARARYLPEQAYLFGTEGAFRAAAVARVTARCIARWADRYAVHTVNPPIREKTGRLPRSDVAMQAIDAIYDWLDHLDVSPYAVAMRLYQDDQPLLDQGEGFPGALMLSSAEYRALQECWKRHALPADLYFPADQERIVIEPVKGFGGVYRAERRYTPRQWAERIPGPAGDAQMPSEDERARALVGAWATFSEALMLRILQLSEPEVVDEHIKERNDLAKLYGQVQSMLRKAPSLQPYLDRRVEQDSQ